MHTGLTVRPKSRQKAKPIGLAHFRIKFPVATFSRAIYPIIAKFVRA